MLLVDDVESKDEAPPLSDSERMKVAIERKMNNYIAIEIDPSLVGNYPSSVVERPLETLPAVSMVGQEVFMHSSNLHAIGT